MNVKSFDEVFDDKTKYGTKVKTDEYHASGKHLIIDQGQSQVAGYTDLEQGLFEDVPAIIFGDHTRVIKYVDAPFFLGADGVKVLRSKYEKANYRYLYYALKSVRIPNTGYNRHFKWLKETRINYPDVEQQEEIVRILDGITEIIDKRQQQLAALDDLIKARFVEMFGDPVNNEKGWNTRPLLSMGSCKNGMNFHYDDSGIEINCLGVGDFKDYSIIADTASLPTVSLNEMPSTEYLLRDDDIVFVRSNGNKKMVGRSVAVYPGTVPTTFSGFCIRYRRDDDTVITPYLLRVLKAESMRQKMYGRGANIQNLNQQTLSSLDIPVPPKAMQEQFAAFVAQVDKSKVVIQKAIDDTQLLFDSLMQRYFS
ncbi:MAG: restriction endonuclease subunit S [Oscillospiraceae bacterium]|nr:restriction endonuclease subunit S [Oscillospiraceae bacterium]